MQQPDLTNARWRTSTLSSAKGKECVEVAPLDGTVAVRDSKQPDGPAFVFAASEWRAFAAAARDGFRA